MNVDDREQLIYLLTEAAEIEHGLMCCYLFAAWSLKQSVDEGITTSQLARVESWRTRILAVAMEEMLHLALVNNVLMSIGAPPHFSRPNFPVPSGYHPANLVLKLSPCSRDTLAHFIYLERPEGMKMSQAKGFETELHYARGTFGVKLTPNAEDYATIEQLYSGIDDGARQLPKKLGEKTLFLGHPQAQIDTSLLPLTCIQAVVDLQSALSALATIVEQGEGGREDHQKSHFAHFSAIAAEYDDMEGANPLFLPYRALAPLPVMFRPLPVLQATYITDPGAARTLDLCNACYGLMLRLLASGSGANYEATTRKVQIECAITMMLVVKPLSLKLTTFPADDKASGAASMNFHLPRSTLALPQRESELALLSERAHELAAAAQQLDWMDTPAQASITAQLANVGVKLAQLAAPPGD